MALRSLAFALLAGLCCPLLACGGSGDAPAGTFPYTLTDVTPLEGSTAGGTPVTLHGTGFRLLEALIAGVRFGEEPADDVVIVDDTTITCVSPPGRVGSVAVVIAGRGEEEILLTGGYRYVASLLLLAEGAGAPVPGLWEVDLDARRMELIGPVGHPLAGLASAPDGRVYGVEEGGEQRLLRVDPVTGVGRPVALVRDGATDLPVQVADITFVGNRLIGRTAAGLYVEIDTTLGATTPLPSQPALAVGVGLTGSAGGQVHLTPLASDDPLILWDPVAGTTTPGAALDFADPAGLFALTRHTGGLYALWDGAAAAPALVRIHPTQGWTEPVMPLPATAGAIARHP